MNYKIQMSSPPESLFRKISLNSRSQLKSFQVASADSCVVIVIIQGSAHATLHQNTDLRRRVLHSGFYYVKKTKRFVILSSDKSSERNLSCFFDIIKPRRLEHLLSEEPFSSDPYFNKLNRVFFIRNCLGLLN